MESAVQGPRAIGKYQVRRLLGSGAMGVVYLAHDPDIDRPVAIKTLHGHMLQDIARAGWMDRFAGEARSAGRVLHPNLVIVFDYLEQESLPYIVMEYVPAGTLEDRMKQPRLLSLTEVGSVMSQSLAGLSAIHRAGIIHRDLKPANVMMLDDGTVKLTDFGVARLSELGLSATSMVGTPAYMSPEQFLGEDVDTRSDLFAMGVILYELLTGQKPFQAPNLPMLTQAVMSGQVAPPSQHAPELPPALDRVTLRALARDKRDRFATAEEFASALADALTTASDAHEAARAEAVPVLMLGGSGQTSTMHEQLPSETLVRIEKLMVDEMGPIARHLVRSAAKRTTAPEAMVDELAGKLDESARGPFRKAAIKYVLGGGTLDQTRTGGIDPATQDKLVKALTPLVGPMAKIMVKRAAAKSATPKDLLRSLSGELKDPAALAVIERTLA